MRVVHRRGTETDHLCAISDAPHSLLAESRKNHVLLSAEQVLEVGHHIDRADRGQVVVKSRVDGSLLSRIQMLLRHFRSGNVRVG